MMLKITDDNDKQCIVNEKYITAVHCYPASNGNGKAIKVLLCHTGYLGLWYRDEKRADEVFAIIEAGLIKNGWRG